VPQKNTFASVIVHEKNLLYGTLSVFNCRCLPFVTVEVLKTMKLYVWDLKQVRTVEKKLHLHDRIKCLLFMPMGSKGSIVPMNLNSYM